MKLRKTFLFVLLVACFAVIFTPKVKATGEVVTTSWVVNEIATDLTVSDVKEGGIGRVSYYTLPDEELIGNPEESIYNSVFIPVSNYDVNSDRVSIKYRTNINVTGHNITLYARCDEAISESGDIIEANDVLIGWFENWNVTTGKAVDNEKFITINHNNYTKTRDVLGLVINFGWDDGDDTNEKWMDILGVTYHKSSDTPTFASDPKDPTLSVPTITSGTVNNNDGVIDVTITNSDTLTFNVNDWNREIYNCIVMKIVPFNSLDVTFKSNGNTVFEHEFIDDTEYVIEFNVNDDALTQLIMEVTGSGTFKLSEMMITSAPHISSYSTSNTSYFSKFDEISEGTYQIDMVRNGEAGFPKVIVNVANWRSDYDVICIDINVIDKVALLGMTFNDSATTYLFSHWDTDSFLQVGEHKLTCFNVGELCPGWKGTSFALYVNPNAQETAGYTYDGEIKLGIWFMKSSQLSTPSVTFDQETYEFEYDGEKHTITPTIAPSELTYEMVYDLDGQKSSSGAQNAGVYTVTVNINGNRSYKSISKTVQLTITKSKLLTPVAEDFEFDYELGLIGFDDDIVVNTTSTFDPESEIMCGANITPGQTLYAKRPESVNGVESEVFTFTVPSRPKAPENVNVNPSETSLIVDQIDNAEYCLVTNGVAGDWQESNVFSGLTKNTDYVVRVRIKGTLTSFESEVLELNVKTLGSTEPEPTESTTPTPTESSEPTTPTTPTDSGKKEKKGLFSGCDKGTGAIFLPLLFILFRRKKYINF